MIVNAGPSRSPASEAPSARRRNMMIRDAPSSIARRTGVLEATAPSINASPAISTVGKMPGIAVLARIASTTGPAERQTANPC